MNEAMWKFLKPFVIERLGEVFVDSKEYNQAVEREALCFEQLKKILMKNNGYSSMNTSMQ